MKKGIKKIPVLVVFFTSLLLMLSLGNVKASGEAASSAKVYVDPSVYTATASGDIFTVDVNIANISNLQGFEFKLGYNTTILDALEVVEGSFLKGFGTTFPAKLETNETVGSVWVAVVVLGQTPAEGDGTLATVSFKSTGIGECVFDLYDIMLSDPYGHSIDLEDCPQGYDVIGPPVWSYTFRYVYWPSPPSEDPLPLPGGVVDGFCFDKMIGVIDAYVDGEAAAAGWKVGFISSTTVVFSAEDVMASGTWSGFHIVAPEATDGPVDWFCDHGAGAAEDNDLLHGPNPTDGPPPPPPPPPSPHDVAVIDVTPSQTSVYQGDSLPINVAVENQGDFAETFNVIAYYGNATITPENWDVFWSMGDAIGDGYINMTDIDFIARYFGQTVPPAPRRADINSDGRVDIRDLTRAARNYGLDIWAYFISGGVIGTQTVNNLLPGGSATLVFTWDTTGVALDSYIISAYATPVPDEIDKADNNFEDGVVTIRAGAHLTVQTEPLGITTIPGEGWYDIGTSVTLEAPAIVPVSAGVQYRFDHWTVDGNIASGNPITVHMDTDHTATASYVRQYYLTVVSDYDTPGGEGWYDEGETAYTTLAIGLEQVDGLAYGFAYWSGDASGWDLLSDPIVMDAPKTAIANWESSEVYGDVRTIGFWKHQVNVWYFTELAETGMNIRGIGTAQISQGELMAFLIFIDGNSDYFGGKIVVNNGDDTINKLETLRNAYDILRTPRGPDSMKMRAEQQLLAVWLNLTHNAFFWNTELSQDNIYTYYEYNFENDWGLTTIGEAILFCEAELAKTDGNYEAAKAICDSINNNLGIIWGT